MKSRLVLVLILLVGLSLAPRAGEVLTGHVVAITDGDTLTLLTEDHQRRKIRLASIDSPEQRQPYGTRAREALAALAFDQDARVVVTGTDRYGRTLGRIWVGETDVNAALVAQGAAWVYRRYSQEPALLALEAEARAQGRGLWSLPSADQVPPWEWRAQRKRAHAPQKNPA